MVQVPWPIRNRIQTLELVIATDCKAASINLVFVVAAYQCSFLLKLSSKFLDVTHLGQAKMRVLVITMLVVSFSRHPDIDNAVISACIPRLFPWRHHELVDGCARDCLQTRDRTKKVSLKFSKGYALATPIWCSATLLSAEPMQLDELRGKLDYLWVLLVQWRASTSERW